MDTNRKLKIKNYDSNYFKNNEFIHIGDGVFIHEFPVYKWNGFITIKGRFTIYDDSNEVMIDVYQEDGRPYAPYYHSEDSEVMMIVLSNIRKECKKLNIIGEIND